MAHALADDRRAHPDPRARRLRAAGSRELESGRRSGRTCATGRPSAGSTSAASEFRPYTHYSVGGNTKFWGSVLYRLRREDFQAVEHVDGVSPAWPIDYETLAPYYDRAERAVPGARRSRASIRPSRRAGRSRTRRFRTRRGWPAIVEQLRAQGLHPSPLPLGLIRPGEPGGCILCNTCNSFPCRIHAKSDAEVCGVAAGARRSRTSTLWTNALRATAAHRCRRAAASRPSRSSATARSTRVDAPLVVVVVRRGELGGAAAALGQRRASRRPGEFVGPRRPPLHGAPGDDDAGVPSVPEEPRRCFRRRSRSTTSTCAGPDTPYPLGQIQSQGRTHGVMAQTVVPWIPLWAYEAWVARGVDWLAMSEDLPRAGQSRHASSADGRIRLHVPPEQRRARTSSWCAETTRILQRLGFWKVDDALAQAARTRRTSAARCASAPTRATSVLDPFCRAHDVDNLFVVDASFFPSSAAVNPGADDRRRRRCASPITSASCTCGSRKLHHGKHGASMHSMVQGPVPRSAARR